MPKIQSYKRVHSTCPHDCPSTCALEVELLDEHTIGRIYGAKDNSYTAGVICSKVARYAERVHHPDRLGQPLRRVGQKGVGISAFEAISWGQALDEVSENFQKAIDQYGSETLWPFHYAGTMGLLQRDALDCFRHCLKTSRQHSTYCTSLSEAGWKAGVGGRRGSDTRDMVNSDLIVVWGGNPVSTQINVMQYIARAKRGRNSKLVVIDPYRTATAEQADMHLMLQPGSDGALACAVMHVLFAEGYVDQDYLQEYTDVPDELENHLATKTPQWASSITGLDVDTIMAFARMYGKTSRSFIRIGYGFTRSRNGAANMHAVSCLPALTGAWRHQGGGALYSQGDLYGVDQSIIKGIDQLDSDTRVFDQSRIGDVLCGNSRDLQGGAAVSAMIIQNTNPVVVAPETKKVIAGMQREDLFICVHEQFMTETAAMADIVLPATMFLEHDDFYQASGHTHLQTTRQVIEAYSECRSNHQVLSELAKRLAVSHPCFETEARDLIDQSLQRSGYLDESSLFEQHWQDCATDFETANFVNGFDTPDKRFHFKPDWRRVGQDIDDMPVLPDYMPVLNSRDADHPFRLVAAPARHFLNTSFTETPSSQGYEKRPTIKIHPQDASDLKITDGQKARVGNRQADIVLHAEIFDGLQPGVVVIESIWPNKAFEEGLGVNALISAEPGKPNGGAVFHDTAIWLRGE
ncbi:MAG: molybdopterin oxidoreductase family protein [Gammaproteobacteria bacterium]|nr:molybdopterin oxidoreductase family protein [Gammaproteobacteria bacterium]